MPIFECSKCGCIENTALCNYWIDVKQDKKHPLCSECDPKIRTWHGEFAKEPTVRYALVTGTDGFLYESEELEEIPPGLA